MEGGEDLTSALAVDEDHVRDTVIALKKRYAFSGHGIGLYDLGRNRAVFHRPA